MNKKALAIAVSTLTAAMASSAYAKGPIDGKVYGKINLSYDVYSLEEDGAEDQDTVKLNSNASRLGFKGATDIGSGLEAIYKLEYEVAVDDGDTGSSNAFKSRDQYVGVKGSFGTVLAGKKDTPLKKAQGKFDQFNDAYKSDIKNAIQGEDRISNIIQYSTPKMSGFQANIAIAPGEEVESVDNPDANDSFADHVSVSATYKMDALYVAAAYNSDVKGEDTLRLVGTYRTKQFEVGGIFQVSEPSEDNDSNVEETAYGVSGAFINGPVKFKGQVVMAEVEQDNAESVDTTLVSLGVDYKLAKKTKAFTYLTLGEEEEGSLSSEGSVFGVGIEHKF